MCALVVALKFIEVTTSAEDQLETFARQIASVDGLRSTCWLRSGNRIMLVQMYESHAAANSFLDGTLFANLGRLPGCQDVFAAGYDVQTQLNAYSVPGAIESVDIVERQFVYA